MIDVEEERRAVEDENAREIDAVESYVGCNENVEETFRVI